jgi:hypothetical protein
MLPADFLLRLRELAQRAFQLLRTANVKFWVTGGTLFSAHVWKHFMPFDDDIDVSVLWEDRDYVWGSNFAKLAKLQGLETIRLRGANLNVATREGGGIRIRFRNEYTPMMDIFFTKQVDETHYAKIDSWFHDQLKKNSREVWHRDWLFPLRDVELDNLLWSVPNQPEMMLKQQYGEKCLESIQSPDVLQKTHKWITYISNIVGAWQPCEISEETDPEKLRNLTT